MARNWRTRWGEIDLVVGKGDTLVFVEVKARKNLSKGSPEEALTPHKKKKLIKLAQAFLATQKTEASHFRFDLVAVDFSRTKPQIRHYQGIIEDDGS